MSLLKLLTHAILILVDQTVNLQDQLEKDANVSAYQRCLALLQTVDLSAKSMQTVQQTRHASTGNVKILVLDYVVSMHTVELVTIYQFVSVIKVTLETHSPVVILNQVRKIKG